VRVELLQLVGDAHLDYTKGGGARRRKPRTRLRRLRVGRPAARESGGHMRARLLRVRPQVRAGGRLDQDGRERVRLRELQEGPSADEVSLDSIFVCIFLWRVA